MTRILTLTSWYPPHHFGGYELSCFDVMTRLTARGHEVRVLCGDERVPGAAPAQPEHEALVFRELRQHLHEADMSPPPLRTRIAIERHDHRVLARHLEEFRPDVVTVWHMLAVPASCLHPLTESGTPVVHVVCDNWPRYIFTTDPWISLFEGGLLRAVAGRAVAAATGMPTSPGRFADRGTFCFVSASTRDTVTAQKPWSYPSKTIVYSGIERAAFAERHGSAAAAEPAVGSRLLYVGRLHKDKGVATLIRALALLPRDVTLDCFGRGAEDERNRLRTLATELGVSERVTFGSLERDELACHYAAADVVVFPSEWPEPFGLVPLEAMACGTPVVASGVGGSAEFLRDGENCVLFPPGDWRALAEAITRVLADGDLRCVLVKGGAETAFEFDVGRLADTLEGWFVATAMRFTTGVPRDRAEDLAAAGVTALPERLPPDTSDLVIAERLASVDGPVIDLRRGGSTIRAGGATVRARPDALPFRDGSAAAVVATEAHDGAELVRVLRRDGAVLRSVPNVLDALHARARLLERVRLGPARPRAGPRHSRPVGDARFEVVARHAVAWTGGGRKRALGSKLVRFAPLRRFGPAVVIELRRRGSEADAVRP